MTLTERAAEMLRNHPMTRLELERALQTSQQNACIVLKQIGALATKSRPPLYSLEAEVETAGVSLAGVSFVFDLGARA